MKIAFIGTGLMGRPMAERLVSHGFHVTAFDTNPLALKGFCGEIAASPQHAMDKADLVIFMVVSSAQVDEILFQHNHISHLAPHANILLCPTCAPPAVEALATKIILTGRTLIDCPVSGGPIGAMNGTLTLMVACETPIFTQLKPILKALGTKIFHVGERPGQGAMVKMLNNLLAGVNLTALGECFAFAERTNLDKTQLLEIFQGSAAGSYMANERGARMITPSPAVKTHLDILRKDLTLIVETGHALNAQIPLAEIALSQFNVASESGFGLQDDSQIIQSYRS